MHTEAFTQKIVHAEAFTQSSFYTQKPLRTEVFAHRIFSTEWILSTHAFTHRSFYTQTFLHKEAFTWKSFFTRTLLHTNPLTHRPLHSPTLAQKSSYIQISHTQKWGLYRRKLFHRKAFAQKSVSPTSFCTQQLIHTGCFTHRFYTDAFAKRSFCTQKLPRAEANTQSSFYAQKFLHTEAFAHRTFTQGSFNTEKFLGREPFNRSPRSCPAGLLPHPFPPFFPLHQHSPHTSAHPGSLVVVGPSPHPFPPIFLAHVRASTHAHGHRAFSPPISTFARPPGLPPTHFHPFPCTHSTHPRIHARSCPPGLLPTHFHPSLAPTLSAHVRANQLASRAVSRLNEIPSIEDAFGKNITGNQGCQKKAITGNQRCSVRKLENYPYIDYHIL